MQCIKNYNLWFNNLCFIEVMEGIMFFLDIALVIQLYILFNKLF